MSVIGNPKLCKNGCKMTIVWYRDNATGDKYFVEMAANGTVTGQRHRCPNYNYCRPQSTATTISTTTTTEAASKLSSVSTEEQTMIQILQIVQRIERILRRQSQWLLRESSLVTREATDDWLQKKQ